MKINISANVSVKPHKVSKPPDLFTINENIVITNEGRSRAQMRKQLMRQSNMANRNGVSLFNKGSKHILKYVKPERKSLNLYKEIK